MKLKKIVKLAKKKHGKGWLAIDSDNEPFWYSIKPKRWTTMWAKSLVNCKSFAIPVKYTGSKHWAETLRRVE